MKKSTARVPDVKKTLEAFLVLAYQRVVGAKHAKAAPLDDLARELKLPEELAEKIARFLESEGLVDYEDQAVDLTIPGMLKAESLLRGDRVDRPDAAKVAPPRTPRRKNG